MISIRWIDGSRATQHGTFRTHHALEPTLALFGSDNLEKPGPEEEFLQMNSEQEAPSGGQAVVRNVKQGDVGLLPELVGLYNLWVEQGTRM